MQTNYNAIGLRRKRRNELGEALVGAGPCIDWFRKIHTVAMAHVRATGAFSLDLMSPTFILHGCFV